MLNSSIHAYIKSTYATMSNDNIEKHELLELEILNQVAKTPSLTTRNIAAHLGCNIRLTHSLVKKLIEKGMVEVKKINSRNWNYFLTPQGISEKASKTYKFFEFSMKYYQEAREKSSILCGKLAIQGKQTIAFIGCGNLAEIAYLSVQENNLQLIDVYGANKPNFLGFKVQNLNNYINSKADSIIVCIANSDMPLTKEIKKQKSNRIEWIFT